MTFFATETYGLSYFVIESRRSGGVLGYFGTVKQTPVGIYDDMLAFELDCSGAGWNRCRVHTSSSGGGGGGLTPEEAATFNFCVDFINEIEEEAENTVKTTGNLSGSSSMQVARDIDGDGTYDTLILIKGEWESEDEDFNEGVMTTTVQEIPYD